MNINEEKRIVIKAHMKKIQFNKVQLYIDPNNNNKTITAIVYHAPHSTIEVSNLLLNYFKWKLETILECEQIEVKSANTINAGSMPDLKLLDEFCVSIPKAQIITQNKHPLWTNPATEGGTNRNLPIPIFK